MASDAELDAVLLAAGELTEGIKPLLAGKSPVVQAAALANLVAIYVARYQVSVMREAVLQAHISVVCKLIRLADVQVANGIAGGQTPKRKEAVGERCSQRPPPRPAGDTTLKPLGARSSLREQARAVLELLDVLEEHQIRETGWKRHEIAALEQLAAMTIDGFSFGDWPR